MEVTTNNDIENDEISLETERQVEDVDSESLQDLIKTSKDQASAVNRLEAQMENVIGAVNGLVSFLNSGSQKNCLALPEGDRQNQSVSDAGTQPDCLDSPAGGRQKQNLSGLSARDLSDCLVSPVGDRQNINSSAVSGASARAEPVCLVSPDGGRQTKSLVRSVGARQTKSLTRSAEGARQKISLVSPEGDRPMSLHPSEISNIWLERTMGSPSLNEGGMDEDETTQEPDLEYWGDTLKEYQQVNEFGPEVASILSSAAKCYWHMPMREEHLKPKLDASKIPQNCQFLIPKKVNKYIFSHIPPQLKAYDKQFQEVQAHQGAAATLLLRAAEAFSENCKTLGKAKKGDDSSKVDFVGKLDLLTPLNDLKDSLCLAGHANQAFNKIRRQMIKPNMPSDKQKLADEASESALLLFGDTLEESLDSINKEASLREAFRQKKPFTPRYTPYNKDKDFQSGRKKSQGRPSPSSGQAPARSPAQNQVPAQLPQNPGTGYTNNHQPYNSQQRTQKNHQNQQYTFNKPKNVKFNKKWK